MTHKVNVYKENLLILSNLSDPNVSCYFEYYENHLCSLDITWQPIKEDLTAHAYTGTLSLGYSGIVQ